MLQELGEKERRNDKKGVLQPKDIHRSNRPCPSACHRRHHYKILPRKWIQDVLFYNDIYCGTSEYAKLLSHKADKEKKGRRFLKATV